MTYALTHHAAVRTQQRGVPHHLIDALMGYADFEAPVAVKGPLVAPRLYPDLPGLIDDPAAGYARLAAMTGGFSRLLTGAAPALEAVRPDAVTSMIDTLTAPARPADRPMAVVRPTNSRRVIAPLRTRAIIWSS